MVFLVNTMYVFSITMAYDLGPASTTNDKIDFEEALYFRPFARFSAYGVGCLAGWLYFEFKNQEKYEFQGTLVNKVMRLFEFSGAAAWASILLGIFLINFFLWIVTPYYHDYYEKDYWPTWVAALYNATCRPMFVLGLALIIFPTFVNRGRGIKALLGSDTFSVTAKLTFGVYLVHDLVIFLPIFGEGETDHDGAGCQ